MPNLRRSFLARLGILTGAGVASAATAATAAAGREAAEAVLPGSRERVVSIADFEGYDPSGRTPSDAAFSGAVRAMARQVRKAQFGENDNHIGGRRIIVPPGTYRLTRPGALFDSALLGGRTQGITIEGDGPSGTVVIIYEPNGDGALFRNQDAALVVRIRNLQFHGKAAVRRTMHSTTVCLPASGATAST